MTKRIGLIGGMSWESTLVYYRLLNERIRSRLGGLHSADLLLWSFDFAEIEALQLAADWEGAASRLRDAAIRLEAAGADCLLIATNTMHKVADEVQRAVGIPLIHIADATAHAIRAQAARRPLLLATRYTMEQDFYRGRLLERCGIEVAIPDSADRVVVHRVIFEQLCQGVISPDSKAAYLEIIARARETDGIDSVILGCTEIGLLIGPEDLSLPIFDTTRLHADAAIEFALG